VKRKRWILEIFFLSVIFLFPPGISNGGDYRESIGERFNGEVMKYEFGFWIFSRAGEGEAAFRSLGHGKYFAAHEGRTLGFVGWVTRYRKDIYSSTMGTINDGKRLIPLRFEEEIIIGDSRRQRVTRYHYAARKIVVETRKEGAEQREEIEIPLGMLYDDPKTAFYNFRAGVYGKVEPGKEFIIPTVPRNGRFQAVRLAVVSREETERRRSAEEDRRGKDLFLTVQIDKDLVGSIPGLVEAWFRSDLVPVSGVAKDVFFFGDVRGKLMEQSLSRPEARPEPRQKSRILEDNAPRGN
jgi:hypothetical protein